ncbi:MerR family transcriptional regulator [Saccharibacillus qingshengii]|uniref:MerR family transcriptional regulator n=1 Tax=Saccharibacillus qingshengii TaxID=1763540 RepID=UPI001557F087|nr:MerR family transcriptional regulator [Saccharibacillus qingshengii]
MQDGNLPQTDWTPKQAAGSLGVSTTTLRSYERQGLIPDVPRVGAGRLLYTSTHMQAFRSLRRLLEAYPIPTAYSVMKQIRDHRIEEALWTLNAEQARIHTEKSRITEIMRLIEQTDFSKYNGRKITDSMNVGEVSRIAGVNPSAVRHWEKEGLIRPRRNPHNGYREFTPRELRRIIVISSLRQTVYFIETIRQLLDDLDTRNLPAVEKSFRIALDKLNVRLERQYAAIAELMRYIGMLGESPGTS